MKKIFFASLLSILLGPLIAQNKPRIDSLERSLTAVNSDTLKVQTLYFLCWEYMTSDPARALDYGKRSLELAKKMGFKKGEGTALSNMGSVYWTKGDYPNAENYYSAAMEASKEAMDSVGLSTATKNLGLVYASQGKYAEALKYLLEIIELDKRRKNPLGMAKSMNYVAGIYYYQAKYSRALEYYSAANKIYEEKNEKTGLAQTFLGMGLCYDMMKDYDQSLALFNRSVQLNKELGNNIGLADNYINMGNVYMKNQDYEKAEKYFNEALALYLTIDNKQGQAYVYASLTSIYSRKGVLDRTIFFSQKALALAKEVGDLQSQKETFHSLFLVYEKKGMYKEAHESHKSYIQLKDSMLNADNSTQINRLEAEFESNKKQFDIERLEMKNSLQTATIKQKSTERNAFLIGLILMIGLAFFIFKSFRQKQKANLIITAQKEEVERQKHLVDEKQKEILDSIHYAKRIQTSLMPREKTIARILDKLQGRA